MPMLLTLVYKLVFHDYQLFLSGVKLYGRAKTRYLKKLKLLNGVDPRSFP